MNKLVKNTLIGALLILVGFFVPEIYSATILKKKIDILSSNIQYQKQTQYELVFIYIGCSSCGASNLDPLTDAIIEIKDSLKIKAETNGFGFHSIGISKDKNLNEELIHLA
ncbi:MAG: hypothetical protein FH748_10575 [Balneolaceae bacterium]|nr:hypothetical protein [Balneolaceae bacterium]